MYCYVPTLTRNDSTERQWMKSDNSLHLVCVSVLKCVSSHSGFRCITGWPPGHRDGSRTDHLSTDISGSASHYNNSCGMYNKNGQRSVYVL